jgi:hypothetical protein
MIYNCPIPKEYGDLERQIAQKQAEADRLENRIGQAIEDGKHKEWKVGDPIVSRSGRLINEKWDILQVLYALQDRAKKLGEPDTLILVSHFLQSNGWTRTFDTPQDAREFDIAFEKAARQFEKYLAQFIPEPEIPKAILPTLDFGISPERWFQSMWLLCPREAGKPMLWSI